MLRVKNGARTWVACTLMMLGVAACEPRPAPPDLATVASRYIRLVRELALHEPSLVDHWLREPPPLAAPRRPVGELAAELAAVRADAEAAAATSPAGDADRARHLQRQLDALWLVTRRLLGESPAFDDEARLGLGLAPVAVDTAGFGRARAVLDSELPGPGPLFERVAAFRRRFQVPESAREQVMQLALDACREATRPALPLPDDESVEIGFVPGLPWDAHARYLGGHRTRIDINASQPLDLTRALRLACHEGYAGHHAQYIFLDDEAVGRRGWTEFGLVAGFGPDLLVSEGAAEAGAELAMPPAARRVVYRERLAPAAGVADADFDRLTRVEDQLAVLEPVIGDIARAYLDNRINGGAATGRLSDEALVADAAGFLTFIERRRTRLLVYAEGRRLVLDAVGADGLRGLPKLLLSGLPADDATASVGR